MLKDKIAVVTGGSRGIGRAICVELAKNGSCVVINYMGNEQKALETEQLCKEFGVKTLVIKADVSKFEQVEAMFTQIMANFGRVDILVNNAGITKDNLLMRMTEQDFDDVININLKGAFLCMKQVYRIMMKQKYGKIINISSVVGVVGNAGQMNYSASKAGVIGMTKSMAKELSARGINVNAVAPGFIKTDMTEELGTQILEKAAQEIPLKRLGDAQDIANTVCFLASDKASYITGQVINIDGGMVM
ncbi:MAG: 3-oxoacyl-[acyl-carrier-protein] reductase [Clostridia bacterium]